MRFNLPEHRFESEVVWHSLHWPAKLVWWWRWFDGDFFAPDFELVRAVGAMSSRGDYWDLAAGFRHHPGNRGVWRRTFNLRLSPSHLHRIVEREFARTPE